MGYIRVRPVGRSIAEKMEPALSRDAPKHTRANRSFSSLSWTRKTKLSKKNQQVNVIGKIQRYALYICFSGRYCISFVLFISRTRIYGIKLFVRQLALPIRSLCRDVRIYANAALA